MKYDILEIMNFLPHRYPFILVDRILACEPNQKIVALKNVTMNEPFFQGHFPGMPIMPGVLIVEAMAQAGGVLVIEGMPPEKYGMPVYFMAMDKVRFRKPVVPGDQLTLTVEMLKARTKVVKMCGVATVDGQRVAEAELMASFGDK
ncbi:3-hydroxyacyl-[acyl-carrier-protein] dehydratase FabZ [Desulfonema ishimotonii]|uniref:3-hydroxyacyl-[acyl-carrier-protein] dehydratase FabZ n=1 Tax=Desulfonema ishimotonii TaxID=45657 RepID=A0A401FSZ2_9BACT|nr:3-hydroxyacyl-ACP dehydratase FabZ [Desulfonema ishimotonii]GBC60060.1 3-hydroxyacyl-[acyl-carrier-protein] dehydratase FabZ [Desulfonema ishimotonii]